MCYEALVNGDAADRPVGALLRGELRAAVRNGLLAAVVVLAVLVAGGASAATIAWTALGALALGAVLHQAVLLAGAGLLRVRAALTVDPTPDGETA